jgi:hypothetical protein
LQSKFGDDPDNHQSSTIILLFIFFEEFTKMWGSQFWKNLLKIMQGI